MFFSVFAGFSFLLALVCLYIGVRTLGKFGWILGFIRGLFGTLLVGSAGVLALAGLDFMSYKNLLNEKPILTISFTKVDDQKYQSTLVFIEEGREDNFEILGEQWQIDARIIRWQGPFKMFGAKPGYRLDRLSGRYYSLEDERRKERTVHTLAESEYGLDMWQWSQKNGGVFPVIEAVYGSATYLPMEDGAIFQVSLSSSGLIAEPLNEVAVDAVNRWM